MKLQAALCREHKKHGGDQPGYTGVPSMSPCAYGPWKSFLGQPGRTFFHRSCSPPCQQAAPGLAHLAVGQLLLLAGWVVLLHRFLAQQTGQKSQNQLHSSLKAREQIMTSVCWGRHLRNSIHAAEFLKLRKETSTSDKLPLGYPGAVWPMGCAFFCL